jgi:hypothetical protein
MIEADTGSGESHLWRSITPIVSLDRVFDLRGDLSALSPVEEVS